MAGPLWILFRLRGKGLRERNGYVLQQSTSLFGSDTVIEVQGEKQVECRVYRRVLLFLMADGN